MWGTLSDVAQQQILRFAQDAIPAVILRSAATKDLLFA
jgi:hypothetical protein